MGCSIMLGTSTGWRPLRRIRRSGLVLNASLQAFPRRPDRAQFRFFHGSGNPSIAVTHLGGLCTEALSG